MRCVLAAVWLLSAGFASLLADEPRKPAEVKITGKQIIENSIGMQFVLIPKGTFLMGSPPDEEGRDDDEPQHEVTLSCDFYLGVHEVTQGDYERVMGENLSFFQRAEVSRKLTARHPVDSVSWEDAVEFCRRLSELPEEKAANRKYRLPTEAEWEYSCRANTRTPTRFSFGIYDQQLGSYAWYLGNSDKMTHEVGGKRPNKFGLHDMHGNVWEWCSDWYGEQYYSHSPIENPQGPDSGDARVLRGGSWGRESEVARCANRDISDPDDRYSNNGFRVLLQSIVVREPYEGDVPVQKPGKSPADVLDQDVGLSSKPVLPVLAIDSTPKVTENSIGMKFVLIPKGTFVMGAPATERMARLSMPQHEVTLSRDFQIGMFEVSQAQYEKVMGTNPSFIVGHTFAERRPTGKQKRIVENADSPNHPVDSVSYDDAIEFCRRLSELPNEQAAGRSYRLPTEAEWEYACRAGSSAAFSFGNETVDLDLHAWYDDNSKDMTHPVGGKLPNGFGLYDMHGNVWEWCSDWLEKYDASSNSMDPQGPETGSFRVLRGGSWCEGPDFARCAMRRHGPPNAKAISNGFRLVCVDLSSLVKDEATNPVESTAADKKVVENSIGMQFVLIPAGRFTMGSPLDEDGDDRPKDEQQHLVTISRDFYFGVHEVTQSQYEKVMEENFSYFQGAQIRGDDTSRHPVDSVSWEDANEFCRRLTELSDEKTASRRYRLPTEAEWEYACRANSRTPTKYSFGIYDTQLGAHGWYAVNSGKMTHAVGGKTPNRFGLYDMHGNVWEWCSDWYGENYYAGSPAADPRGPDSGTFRVLRGGSWDHFTPFVRCASRSCNAADYRGYHYGFRVVLE